MNAKDGTPGRKRRLEPVMIPVSLVDEGCRRIAENISEFTDHAIRFLNLSEDIVSRRIVQILVVHAMDEGGKLLEIIRKAIEAEHIGATSISIDGFYSHSRKGLQAGSIGILAIDWLQSTADGLPPSNIPESTELDGYRIHLESLRRDFRRERESVLYVDIDDGRWLSPTVADELWLMFDALLLGMLAALTLDTLNAGRPIHHLDTVVKKISDPATLKEFAMRIKESTVGGKSS